MHIKDHSAAMKFFRTYDSAASKGKWKEFVDEMEFDSMLHEPRTMAADGGRIGLQDGKSAHLDAVGRKNTKLIRKEKSIKSLFDTIFDAENFGAIRGERRGHGLIPDDWFRKHVSKAIEGDADALKDLSRITGRAEKDLTNAFKQRNSAMMLTRSKAAHESATFAKKVNKDFVELVKSGVTNKADLKKALKVSETGFQDVVSLAFKQSYENRARLNKNPNNPLSSYFGSSSGADDAKRAIGEYDTLIEGFNKIDGIDKARERLITNRIQQVYGQNGSHPNSKMYKTMNDRINEFYKLKKTLPEEIVMNLDHAIPMSLIEQLTEVNTLRANVQPITQALNSGLKAQIDKAYSGAYKNGNKKVMRAIEEIAEKIDLPMGKITDAMIDLGKNPYLTGDMKQVIYNNLVIQNSITEKAGKLDKKLLKQAGLEGFNFDIGKVDTETVAKLFSEGDEAFVKFASGVGKKVKSGGKLYSFPAMLADKELMKQVGKDIGTVGKKGLRVLASDWVWPDIVLGVGEYFNLKQKGAEHDRALSGALELSTLGLVDLEGTEKAILDQAGKLGYSEEEVNNLNLIMQSKQIEKDIRGEYKNLEAIKANLEGDNPDPRLNNWGMVEESQKKLEQLKNDYAKLGESYTGDDSTWDLYNQASQELARTEWNRSLEGRKTRTDPYAGEIGSQLEEVLAMTPGWYENKEKMSGMNPEELDKWNLQERGIGYERVHPQYGAAMSYKQMEPFYDEMDYMYKAEGGIMSLKKKW